MTRIEAVIQALGIKLDDVRGRRAWAPCPIHKATDSVTWFIRLRGRYASTWHCFSCKEGGSLNDLVQRVRNCSFKEAKEFIETRGADAKPVAQSVVVRKRPPVISKKRFQLPSSVIFKPFKEWVSGARDEAKRRLITEEEIKTFKLGYAVDGRLAGRIVIPWIDTRQRIGGYSARTYCDQEPKYITPHEDDNPDLTIMVGEHIWGERNILVVTEGAINGFCVRRVMPELSFGAIGGSEINTQHIIKMSSFKRVLLLTDADKAGDKAASQIRSTFGRGTSVLQRIRLPEEKDAFDVGPEYLYSVLSKAVMS